jgi:hypothetical protein
MNRVTTVCQRWSLETVYKIGLLSVSVGFWRPSELCDCWRLALGLGVRGCGVTAGCRRWDLETV